MRLKSSYFGIHCLSGALEKILDYYHARQLLIVTGKQSFEQSIAKKSLEKLFLKKHIKASFYNDFENNPKLEDVLKGIDSISKEPYDLVLAIGGGSVLDIAKMLNLFANKENNILDYLAGNTQIAKKGKPLIAIPTTAGTGSEATEFSVLYRDKKKYSIAHEYMLPTHAIIDPTLTYDSPHLLAASTALDAYTQAIESFWAVNATPKSQIYAKWAIKLCRRSIFDAVTKQDAVSRQNMGLAAYLSGKAINISKTTAPHALSYELTMKYGIPHGYAVALTIPIFMKINATSKLLSLLECKTAEQASVEFQSLMSKIGLSSNLRALGITDEKDIVHLVDSVNMERLQNNPVKLEKFELIKLLQE